MWKKELNDKNAGHEVKKCRYRIVQFITGAKTIFDLGCGSEKICGKAIGIDINSKTRDLTLDLSNPGALQIFNQDIVDVIFSSHTLEDFYDTIGILKDWWRVLRPGGHLILYMPHKRFYPNVGQPGANPNHKHDFDGSDILMVLDKFASYKLIRNEEHNEDNEYSFELIVQKLDQAKNKIVLPPDPTPKKPNYEALVVRYGGIGDLIIITPLLAKLKASGYRVTLNVTPQGMPPLLNNPNIDEIILQDKGIVPNTELGGYFKILSKGYKKFVNLCESIERTLLFEERDRELWNLSQVERHQRANVNYYERTMSMGGYENQPAQAYRGQIFLSEQEEALCKIFKSKHKGFFNVLWCLKGSSDHKLYPYSQDIMEKILDRHDDIQFFIVGGDEILVTTQWHKRIHIRIGVWGYRQSVILPKYMDLVISPETGVLNAAGCFDTPKIGLLTHSSKENLTKHFINDYSIQSEAVCSPCHKLVHSYKSCQTDAEFGLPICMSQGIAQGKIIDRIEIVYQKWKQQ